MKYMDKKIKVRFKPPHGISYTQTLTICNKGEHDSIMVREPGTPNEEKIYFKHPERRDET